MKLDRRRFLQTMSLGLPVLGAWPTIVPGSQSQPTDFGPGRDIIPAPDDPVQWPHFRQELNRWRSEIRSRIHYDDTLYCRNDLRWSASNYCCGFVMVWDQHFYNSSSGRYQVDLFLDEGEGQFGGYDSIVLWHAYPRIGVDERNQFDFYRDMPGGLAGLRQVVRRCHRRGVRVYIDYNPWDTGTRREGRSDIEALVSMVRALEADGIFLDTLDKGSPDFRARLDAARPGVILEGEMSLPLEALAGHQASWAQWFEDSFSPGVLRAKWIERRHMQHQIRRWDSDHTAELHTAWMNGSGMLVWENVFGCRMAWNPRDCSILRAMLPIQRRYTALFEGESWTPLVPVQQAGVFASLWEGSGLRLWTLVNRTGKSEEGALLETTALPLHRYFDLICGKEIYPKIIGDKAMLTGLIPARGIGCFLSGPSEALGKDFQNFLERQKRLDTKRDFDSTTPKSTTHLAQIKTVKVHIRRPSGMVEIPGATLTLGIDMRIRECGFYDDAAPAGEVYEFQTRKFQRTITLPRFAIDETLVTNAQFAEFLQVSRYRPAQRENLLMHWATGRPPAGKDDHPVVYVSLEDARAYARWAGKRLPTEEEWQYAAQGSDGRDYPWGKSWKTGRCNESLTGATTPVRAFPSGRSPFGCYDMCGNVWQWTESERTDGWTRFCIIRGGSCYAAQGSNWYVDGGPRPVNFATKFLLLWPGLDRCGTIGFRCAIDLT